MSNFSAELIRRLENGDRRALAQGITLVESKRPHDTPEAEYLLTTVAPNTGKSMRIGVSGPPGVGKSTFIERLGISLLDSNHRVAVLAIDPSSSISGGSILADKARMESLSKREQAFIRPSAAGETLGGVARKTQDSLLLCEAAGFDIVIIETVGVGQSETLVSQMTDVFLLLLQPGGGDELQGIKRGILELADIVAVNKSDGELTKMAIRFAAEFSNALQLLSSRLPGWRVPVVNCSALENRGISEIRRQLEAYWSLLKNSGELTRRRAEQNRAWMWREIADRLVEKLKSDTALKSIIENFERQVASGDIPVSVATHHIVNQYLQYDSQT